MFAAQFYHESIGNTIRFRIVLEFQQINDWNMAKHDRCCTAAEYHTNTHTSTHSSSSSTTSSHVRLNEVGKTSNVAIRGFSSPSPAVAYVQNWCQHNTPHRTNTTAAHYYYMYVFSHAISLSLFRSRSLALQIAAAFPFERQAGYRRIFYIVHQSFLPQMDCCFIFPIRSIFWT